MMIGNRNSPTTPGVRILIGLAACWVGSGALLAQAIPVNPQRVVARVNGAPITEADVQDEMEALYPSNTAHGGLRPERLKEIRSKALDELIVQELAYQQAAKAGTAVPAREVRAEFDRLRQRYGAERFDRSLRESGLTRQQYLKRLERRLTLERMVRSKVVGPSRLGPAALRAYYNRNLKKFERPERVRTRLILVGVEPQAKPELERKAKEKIERLYSELKAGKDFAALAREHSEDFYKVKGGDVGWMHRGAMDPEFEGLAFTLPVGEVSRPFRTPYGYNLLKVEAREPARLMPFEEVQDKLKQELEEKRFAEIRDAWVKELRKGAKVEVYDAPPVTPVRASQ
jgi:peptidyl-prolyl cis-trans isomerase C